jgi:SET domain-containing protein
MGVFANKDYRKGEFIVEYDGELINKKEGEKREKEYQQDLGSYIFFYSSHGKKFW